MKHRERPRDMLGSKVAQVQGWGITIPRVIVGIVFLVHGTQKLFDFGFYGVAEGFERLGLPIPLVFAMLVTLVEFLGGSALILGLFTRLAAAALAIEMVVAILLVHLPSGFFSMDGGFEYPLVLLAVSIGLIVAGSGEAALDRVLAARGNRRLVRLLLS